MTSPEKVYDIAVIGGGVVGICSALSLREDGREVLLIDRDAPGQGASYGNAGVISPWSVVPQAMPGIWRDLPRMLLSRDGPASVSLGALPHMAPWLMRFLRASGRRQVTAISSAMAFLCNEAPALYRRHLEGTGAALLVKDAHYIHAFRKASDATLDTLAHDLRRAAGAKVDKIDRAELRRIEPALSPDFSAAVVIRDQARAVDPGAIGAALAEKLIAMGGEVRTARVDRIDHADGAWRIACQGAVIAAQRLVVTAGAWSMNLLRPLGFKAPLTAERGYHVMFPAARDAFENSVMDVDNHIVASAMARGARFAGLAEFGKADAPPTPRRMRQIKRLAHQMAPELSEAGAETWMGVRPSFPDSLPVIDCLDRERGLFAAFGHSHYGLMMAPKTGRVLADLVAQRYSNVDIEAFSISRFAA